ncbi:FHA domain-containing protein [Stagnimonas aquatica]|uniref:FHA domain-containing protein n=1 Tax=Stagnimonas aquatica TaxID=2689987 RepID=A0A3N0VGD2_9GAMM|nr:FHA domain-containing protein [Stagnimonas aquatica]ROH91752.1 FHA domain-containing protein [Stagnimonas aquatica]
MPLKPGNGSFEGAILLAVYSDARGRQLVDGVLDYEDRRLCSRILEHAGGLPLEMTTSRVSALFGEAGEAWQAAQALLRAVEAVRVANPLRRQLSVQVVLDWGRYHRAGPQLRTEGLEDLPGRLRRLPGHAIGCTQALLERWHSEGQAAQPSERLDEGLWLLSAPLGESETRLASEPSLLSSGLFMNLSLKLRGETREFAAADCPLRLGRDTLCTLVLAGDKVSRVHGRIEFEHQKFVYVDDSKNGSYVLTAAGTELQLKRGESLILAGEGAISPGLPLDQQTGDIVRYSCRPSKLQLDAPEPGDTVRIEA